MPAQVIGPLAQFAAILVFTHWMAPGPYGVLTYIMASQDFVFLLCLSWFSQYTIRYFTSHEAASGDSYGDSEFPILAGTILPQIVASIAALVFISVEWTAALIGATVLYTVTRCLALHLGERARAQRRILDYTIAASVGPVVGFAVAFAAVAVIAPTPEVALTGYGIVQALVLVWLVARQRMRFVLRMPDRALLRQALGFGLPLIVAGVAAWFGTNAIRILVDHQLGSAAMGLIAVGWALGQRITATTAMFVTVAAFPIAVEHFRLGSRAEAYRQITVNGLLMFGISLPAAVGLYLLQDSLVPLFVAAPFRAMTIAVLPAGLIAGLCRNIRTHVADQVFVLIERTPIVSYMTIGEALAVVAGCWIGLMTAGPVGAAYGSAAGYTLTMVVSFAIARLSAGLRLPLQDAGLVAVAAVVMAVAVKWLPQGNGSMHGAVAQIALVTAVGAAVYAVAILAFFPVVTRSAWTRWRRLATR